MAADPAHAAAAYLDKIAPAVRLLAAAGTDAGHWRAALDSIGVLIILILLLKSRWLVRVRAALAARVANDRLTSLFCALTLAVCVEGGRTLILALSLGFWPTGVDPPERFARAVSSLPINVLIGGAGLWLLLAMLRGRPRWGWAWLSGLAAVAIAGAVLIPPVTFLPEARGDRPVAGVEAAPILKFVQRGGLNAHTLYVFDSADPFAVDMEGVGPLAHAAVGRAVRAAPTPEAYAAIGHLLGHYRHKDLWSLVLLWSAFGAMFFGAVWALRGRAARGLEDDAPPSAFDARALPIIGLIGWATVMIATPAFNLFDQGINYRADDYAMSLTGDPDALCRWLIATEAASKADPSPVEALLFYDHPPLLARLVNAQRWKADHAGAIKPTALNVMFALPR
jgi:STE24 endopeptidase